jgi:hypothetical protein
MSEATEGRSAMFALLPQRLIGRVQRTLPLGRLGALPRATLWAGLASLFWAVLVLGYGAGYLAMAAEAGLRGMVMLDGAFILLAFLLPIGLIWLASGLQATLRDQRRVTVHLAEEMRPLIAELEATRRALAHQQSGVSDAVEQTVRTMIQTRQRSEAELSETLSRITEGQMRLQATLMALLDGISIDPAELAPVSDEPAAEPMRPQQAPRGARPQPAREADPDEPPLPLLEDADATVARPDWHDLLKALDFPRDDQDFEGFRALQAALRYHPLAQMLQSAEDVLTFLSQEGVYMEDLTVETGDPVNWRRFMEGARGSAVAGVGGILDSQAVELTRALLKSDPVFRDTALFFQRRFDKVLQDFARDAGDQEIFDVANTRSGRAFMLLAGINGALTERPALRCHPGSGENGS